jgi:hypothetical protein
MKLTEKIKGAISLQSLVLRAVIFGAAWFLLPFWLFLVVALYLYFSSLFRPFKLIFPFLVTLFFAFAEQPQFFTAILLAAIFYLILGIKDLVFIDRKSDYGILILLIMFLIFTRLFSHYENWSTRSAFFYAFAAGVSFFILFIGLSGEHVSEGVAVTEAGAGSKSRLIMPAVASLAVWQITLAVFFLPLEFLYQSALAFLFAAVLLEIASDYLNNVLSRRKMLVYFSAFLTAAVFILGSARWGM